MNTPLVGFINVVIEHVEDDANMRDADYTYVLGRYERQVHELDLRCDFLVEVEGVIHGAGHNACKLVLTDGSA